MALNNVNNVSGTTGTTQSVAPVLVNRVPLDAAAKVSPKTKPPQTTADFWSTPARPIGDKTREVYEIGLNSIKTVNTIGLDLPIFPYVATLESWDNKTSKWTPVLNPGGRALQIVNTSSNPSRLPTQVTQQAKVHPQHGITPSHWQKFELQIKLTQTNRFRLIMTRNLAGGPPVDTKGKLLDYSLGVRNFRVALKVRSKDNVPQSPPVMLTTQSESFATATDLYGTPVSYALRQNLPQHLFSGHIWKCEPQPVSFAVVPFYVDVRNADGTPQTLDHLYLEPLYSGATVNMYYSTGTPNSTFATHDFPIEYPLAQLHGDYSLSAQGITFSGISPGYVEIDNTAVQWEPSRSWNLMMQFTPSFPNNAIPNSGFYTIFDFDAISMRFNSASKMFELTTATTFLQIPLTTWNIGAQIRIFLIYSQTFGLTVYVNDQPAATFTGVDLITETCQVFRFGGKVAGEDPGSGNYQLNYFMLKREEFTDGTIFNDFKESPASVIRKPFDPTERDLNTQNALLRFDPSWLNLSATASNLNPTGFRGGVGDTYADLVWTPIQRDFKLQKGYYDLPRITATVIKLEFTNLTPQPYSSVAPINRTVLTYSKSHTTAARVSSQYQIPPSATRTNMTASGSTGLKFNDGNPFPSTTQPFTPPSLGQRSDFSPTEVYYASDPELVKKLRRQSPLFGMQSWQPNPTGTVKFTATTRHVYETINIVHDTKVAYFVGLKAIKVYRRDYLAQNDVDAYYELFQDKSFLDGIVQWNVNPLQDGKCFYMCTPSAEGEFVTMSAVFPSVRNVYAIQYATVQSPPVQLLTDAEFDQTDYLGQALLWFWDGVGDGSIKSSSDLVSDIGSTVLVSRSTPPPTGNTGVPPTTQGGPWLVAANRTYGGMGIAYSSWGEIAAAVQSYTTTYGDLSGVGPAGVSLLTPSGDSNATHFLLGGITSNEFIVPKSTRGRIYGAARVVTTKPLRDSLWVQIVTQDGTVLSEAEVNAEASGVNEWYCGYEVGTGLNPADGTALPADTPLSVRVVQKTATGDSWYCDNISLFEDPILWEFSVDGGETFVTVFDIRNNPNGVFVFPTPGNQLQWKVTSSYPNTSISALEIRPWYQDLLGAIAPKTFLQGNGPNMQPLDHYNYVDQDPFFELWDKPIPQEWFINYRLSLFPPRPARGTPETVWILPERIVPVIEALPPDSVASETNTSGTIVLSDAIVLPD